MARWRATKNKIRSRALSRRIFLSDGNEFVHGQVEMGADETVARFIADVLLADGPRGSESIRTLFRAGYCYYFAHILRLAFDRGQVCWTAPYGHFVWVDDNGNPYDVEGLYVGEATHFVPEGYLGDAVNDFRHMPGLCHGTSDEEIKRMINEYEASAKE